MTELPDELTVLRLYVADRQEDDWHRLDTAISRASNGVWSIECGIILNDIRRGMRITGPANPCAIPWIFSISGIYSRVTGVDITEFIERYREMMSRHTWSPRDLASTYSEVASQMEEDIEE